MDIYEAARRSVRLKCFGLLFLTAAWLPLIGRGQSQPAYSATINTATASLTGPSTVAAGSRATFTTSAGASFTNNSSSTVGFRVITEITIYDVNNNVISRTESSGGNVTVAPGKTQPVGTNGSTNAPVGDEAGNKKAKVRQKVTTDSNIEVTDWIDFPQLEAPFLAQPNAGGGYQNQE
jgi:uncharacterized membrane-anchored protein